MRVALDTSVLLDVLAGDRAFGRASQEALRRAYDSGSLVACDVVWAEVRANFDAQRAFQGAMDALGVEFLPLSRAAAALAGDHWRAYHRRRTRQPAGGAGREKRVVADFLVGAHAQLQTDALLTRDRGFFRSYFKRLKLIEPGQGQRLRLPLPPGQRWARTRSRLWGPVASTRTTSWLQRG